MALPTIVRLTAIFWAGVSASIVTWLPVTVTFWKNRSRDAPPVVITAWYAPGAPEMVMVPRTVCPPVSDV